MKACGYCGRENEDNAAFCAECGTGFEAEIPSERRIPALPFAKRLRELNAWSATAILLTSLLAQVICVILVGLVVVLYRKATGSNPADRFESALSTAMPIILVLIPISSGIATILVARSLVRSSLRDTSAIGAAWVRGHWLNIIKGFIIGLFLGACIYTMIKFLGVPVQSRHIDHLGRMMATPGLWQILNGVSVMLLAPFTEEILFRGVLYGGYRKSFGAFGAAVLTTGLFCMLHLPQVAHYTAMLIGVVVASLAELAARLSSGAVGPAIGVHAGYNTFLFALALLRQHTA
jgi:membrane protease YdiL (CAAX protease family)